MKNKNNTDFELKKIFRFFEHRVPRYIFMVTDDERVMNDLIKQIQTELKKKKKEISILYLNDKNASVYRQLKAFYSENKCDGLFIINLNSLIYRYPGDCIDQLNKSRDAFENIPLPIVLAVNNNNLRKIINDASDFYQFRHLPDFHFEKIEALDTGFPDTPEPLPDNFPDMKLKAELLENQLKTLQKGGKFDNHFLDNAVLPLLNIYIHMGNFKKMRLLYNQYISSQREVIQNNQVLGTYYYKVGNFENAMACYNKALQYYKDSGNRLEQASCYHQLGCCYFRTGNYKEALEYNEKSLGIKEEINDCQGISRSFFQYGRIYQAMGNYDQALSYYEKTLDLADKNSDPEVAACCLEQIGVIYQKKEKFEDALKAYQKSQALREQIGDLHGLANNRLQMGNLYFQEQEYPAALESFTRAFGVLLELESPNVDILKNNIQEIRKKIPPKQFEQILNELNIPSLADL